MSLNSLRKLSAKRYETVIKKDTFGLDIRLSVGYILHHNLITNYRKATQ